MSILIHRQGVLQSGGAAPPATHTRTPLVAAQDIPAGFIVPIHTDMFDNATHNNDIYANIQADGGDLRVFEDSGFATQLPLELVAIDTGVGTEKLIAYFRTTSAITNGNTIAYLRTTIAGGESQPGVADPFGRNAVWTDYDFVSHDLVTDSSGNSTITNTGGAAHVDGFAKGFPARGFGATDGVGSTDISQSDLTADQTTHTISWIHDLNDIATVAYIFDRDAGNRVFVQNAFRYVRAWSGATARWVFGNGDPSTGVWQFFAVAYDGGDIANDPFLQRNDTDHTPTLEDVAPSGTLTPISDPWDFGNRRSDSARHVDGKLGGMRIRPEILTTTWLDAEYAGYSTPASLATAGALVSV